MGGERMAPPELSARARAARRWSAGPLTSSVRPARGDEARRIAILVARICGLVVALVAAIALVARVGFAPSARHWLGFSFGRLPATPGEAWSILRTNGELALMAFVAAALVRSEGLVDGRRRRQRVVVRLVDVAILLTALRNVAVVGLGFGAYGTRMLGVVLPHGPVELLGYAQALALYALARCGPVRAATAAALAGGGLATLAVAAVLETFAR
jgi:hypothetical protein